MSGKQDTTPSRCPLRSRWKRGIVPQFQLTGIIRKVGVYDPQQEYARGDVHKNRAACLFSLLKPYLRVFRGVNKGNLPGYVGFFPFLRNFRQRNACEQAELILRAALDPTIASRAKKGELVSCSDHFDLLQTAIN